MTLSRKIVNQTTVASADPKRKEKIIEAAELVDRRPNLADVHISDAENSHSNTASSLGMQTAEPQSPLDSDQLLQMLSTMRKQMENQ